MSRAPDSSITITARAAWWSFCVSTAVERLAQIATGKEEWVRHVAERWSTHWWSAPLSCAALLGGAIGLWGCVKDEREGGRS